MEYIHIIDWLFTQVFVPMFDGIFIGIIADILGQVTQVIAPVFDGIFIDIFGWLCTQVIASESDEIFIEIIGWLSTQAITSVLMEYLLT